MVTCNFWWPLCVGTDRVKGSSYAGSVDWTSACRRSGLQPTSTDGMHPSIHGCSLTRFSCSAQRVVYVEFQDSR